MAAQGILLAIGLASVTGVLFSALVSKPAISQEAEACRIIGGDDIGYLERCGNRFRYIGLSVDDIRGHLQGIGGHGQFYFRCPIKPMCAKQPEILGWFIDRAWWARSARGEDAVFAALRQVPINAISWSAFGGKPPKSPCGMIDVQIAGVPGRGVCNIDGNWSQIVIVGGNDDFAFVLTFMHEGMEYSTLLEKVREMLPKFQIELLLDEAVLRKGFQ